MPNPPQYFTGQREGASPRRASETEKHLLRKTPFSQAKTKSLCSSLGPITTLGNEECARFFCLSTNFLNTPKGRGHPVKIPRTSQIPLFETQGRQTFDTQRALESALRKRGAVGSASRVLSGVLFLLFSQREHPREQSREHSRQHPGFWHQHFWGFPCSGSLAGRVGTDTYLESPNLRKSGG